MKKSKLFIAGFVLVILNVVCPTLTLQAQYSDFHVVDFNGTNGNAPYFGSLVSDGTYLYGMTLYGGSSSYGTIFKVKPDGTGDTVLLNFNNETNGSYPYGSLLYDAKSQSLYGMTYQGGKNNLGTIFKINPDGTGYSTLLDFSSATGANPFGSLISDGTFLYGMTYSGGKNSNGTIFKIQPDGQGYVQLLDFDGINGSYPYGDLIYDGTFLYGMTTYGGKGNGVVFKIQPDGNGFTKLLDFDGINGYAPQSSLFSDGVFLYGTTTQGGSMGYGNIFKIQPDGSGYTNLLNFNNTNGSYPHGFLISDGTYLYGLTGNGGAKGMGTIFKIQTDGTGYSDLFDFDGTNGSNPYGSLYSDNTYLYGMTYSGGKNNNGTVFKFNPYCSSVTLTSKVGTDVQTICFKTAIDDITYQFSGSSASVTGLPPGLKASNSGNVLTISGTPDTIGYFNYVVTTTGATECSPDSSLAMGNITVNALLTAAIEGTTTVCQNSSSPSLTFTGANGNAPYTFTYNINGGANLTIISDSSYNGEGGYYYNNFASLSVPTNTAGTFVYALIDVQSSGSYSCPQAQTGSDTVIVNQGAVVLASASGTDAQAVCLNTPITNISYQILGNNASVTGLPHGVSGSYNANVFTISGTPDTSGYFSYFISVTAPTGCVLDSTIATGSIDVNSLPTATIDSSTIRVCPNNEAAPQIVFTGNGDTSPYTFTYSINGGLALTITTQQVLTYAMSDQVGNNLKGGGQAYAYLSVPTDSVGTFVYSLISVSDGSSNACSQAQSGRDTLIVIAPPTITLSAAAPFVCQSGQAESPSFANLNYSSTTGNPYTYSIYYDTAAQAVGFSDVYDSMFHTSPIVLMVPGFASTGSYNANITLRSYEGCYDNGTTFTVSVNPTPTITLGTNPVVCQGTTIANLPYSATSGNPYLYSIDFDTIAEARGFIDIIDSTLSPGKIIITVPAAAPTITYNANLMVTNCNSNNSYNNPISITVKPNAAISLTSGAGTNVQSKCINTVLTTITYSVSGGATGASVSGLPTGVSGAYSAGVFSISGTPTVASTSVYTVTTIGSCAQAAATGTITVKPNAAIALTSAAATKNQSKCINTAITTITYSVSGGGTGAGVSGLPTGVSGSYSAGVFAISGTPTVAGTSIYTVTTAGTCVQTSATGTITAKPNAAIALTSAAATKNQSKCINTAITTITYSVSGGGTGAGASGLPTGVSGSYSAGVFTISGTPTVAGTSIYTVTTAGTCVQTSATGTITVNPNAAISLTSGAGTNVQSKCINTALTTITYSVSGGGTGASASGLPTGVSGSYSAGVFTISGTPTVAGTSIYTVTTTGTCVQTSATGTITVNPNAAISLTSGAGTNVQSKCINTALTTITYSVSGGGTGASASGLPTGVSGSYSAGVFTISGTPTVAGTSIYTVTTTGTCVQTSATGTITVNPNAAITLTSAVATKNQSKCVNTTITTITYSVSGGATSAGVTGLPTGVTGVFSAGVFTISGKPSVVGTSVYTVTTTGTCVQASATGTITVKPNAALTLTSAAATKNQSKCINTAITTITYSVSGGGTGAGASGLPTGVSGSYSAGVFTISGTPTVAGTSIYTVTTTGTCVQTSATGTITVNPNAAISLTSGAGTNVQSKCINTALTTITYSVSGGGTGASASGLPTGVSGSYSAGVFTISGTPTVAGTSIYTVTTTGTCVQTSATGTITVNPNAAISLTSGAGTNVQSKCINTALTTITYSVSGGGTGASASGLPTGVSGSYSAGVFTISGTPTVAGTSIYTVTTAGTCVQTSATGTITAKPNAAIALTSAAATKNQSKCINTAITTITYSVSGGGTGAGASGLPTGVSGSYSAGVFTISGTPTVAGTSIYTVTTTGTCVQTSATGTITVNPNAAISLTSGAGTNVQSKCINTALTTITYSVSGGGTGASASGLPTGVSGSYSAGVFTISGTPTVAGTSIYTVTTTGTCVQTSATGTITVNPNAAISLTSGAGTNVQSKCINTALTTITYSVSGGGTGASASGLPTGVSGSYSAGVFTISGTPTVAGTSIYTVTTTGTCVQTSATGTITVNPNAAITLTSAVATKNQSKCVNTTITTITYSVSGGATSAGVTGLPTGVTGVFSAGVFTISGKPSVVGTSVYTVTTTGTCVQASATGTITVKPNAALTLTSAAATKNQSKCINTAITTITYSVSGGGTSASALGLPVGLSGSYSAGVFTISGTPTVAGTSIYTVTTTGTCVQTSATGTITVKPDAAINLTSLAGTDVQSNCINVAITSITYSISGGGTGASASGLPAGVSGTYSAGVFTISGSPSVASTSVYTVTTIGTCVQTSMTGTIVTVSTFPTVSILSTNESSLNACNGYLEAVVKGVPPYHYVWNDSAAVNSQYRHKVCNGDYTVIVKDSTGCSAIAQANVGSDQPPIKTGKPLTLSISSNAATSKTACDGKAFAKVTGGTAPYQINFAGKVFSNSTASIDSLCSGFYTVNATDNAGNSASFVFVVGAPGSIFPHYNPTYKDSVIVDSLVTSALPNCTINYDSIDSIKVTNFSLIGRDSVNVIWTVYEKKSSVQISQTVQYGNISSPGVYVVILDLFCTSRTSGNVRASDEIYIDNRSTAGINSIMADENSLVYPNPFSDKLNVVAAKKSAIRISDISGKEVYIGMMSSENLIIDLYHLNPGIYFVTITNNQTSITKKIIKN